jgi:hypothetical protein
VAITVLASTLGLGAATAYAKNLVVPWVNNRATPALIGSLLPKPLPAPAPKTDAPPCTSSQLALQPVTGLQWSQNSGVAVRLRNTGSSACLLRGTPKVAASSPGHPNVVATPLGLAATDGEVANTPAGGLVSADVSVPVACASNPGGSNQGLPTYRRLVITLPGGGTRTISGLNLTFPCGMAVTPFNMPKPSPTYARYWIQYLKPRVALPASVKAGGTLVYEITLTNPLSRPVALTPCPAYIEHSSSDIKLEYRLNCTFVHSIPAHSFSIYQMKMAIPDTTPSGPMTVFWSVIGPGTISSHATVDVRSAIQ